MGTLHGFRVRLPFAPMCTEQKFEMAKTWWKRVVRQRGAPWD